jgi:hypothetical protein
MKRTRHTAERIVGRPPATGKFRMNHASDHALMIDAIVI